MSAVPARLRLLAIYFSGSFCFGLTAVADFLVPLRARELGAPLDQIGLIIAAGAILPAVLSISAGELSDRWGARKMLLASTLACGVSALAMSQVVDYLWLIPLQVVNGLARSAGWVASQTYIVNYGSAHERAMHLGRLSFAANGSTIVYPLLLGPIVAAFGLQAGLVLLAMLSVVYVAVTWFLPDVVARRSTVRGGAGGFGAAGQLLRQRSLQVVLLLTFVRVWTASGWRPFIPLYLTANGFDSVLIGSVLAVSAVVSTITSLWADGMARRLGVTSAIVVSLVIGALGTALSPLLVTMPLVYVPGLLIGFSVGITLPLLIVGVSQEVAPDQRGVAMGLRTGMNSAAGALAPLLIGAIAQPFGLPLALGVSAAISGGLIAGALGLRQLKPTRPAQPLTAP